MIEPLRRLRIFVAMAARLLPGVRCSTACTEYRSPSWRMIIPGRNCVARILLLLMPTGSCGRRFESTRLRFSRVGGVAILHQESAADRTSIIDAAPRAGQREARQGNGSVSEKRT